MRKPGDSRLRDWVSDWIDGGRHFGMDLALYANIFDQ